MQRDVGGGVGVGEGGEDEAPGEFFRLGLEADRLCQGEVGGWGRGLGLFAGALFLRHGEESLEREVRA